MSDDSIALVVFLLDEQRYAVRLEVVDHVVRAVAVDPLPQAPGIVAGVINVAGRVTPVVDLRRRFHLPPRATRLEDHLVIARTAERALAFVVDQALGVRHLPARDLAAAAEVAPHLDHVAGVARLEDGLLFVHDLETFLSLDEARTLDAAMAVPRENP